MAGKSASLLTQTQRSRLNNEFADVDEEAKRRDQQLIRERVRSGVLDFRLLADYPDRQYDLAFTDVPERDLRTALADTYLAAERIRDLHRYDRDQLLSEARARADDVAARTANVRSLERLDLRTEVEVRQQTEERLVASRWEKRAMGVVKLAGAALISSSALFLVVPVHLSDIGLIRGSLYVLTLVLCLVSAGLVFGHAIKHDLASTVATLSKPFHELGQIVRRRWEQERNRRGKKNRAPQTTAAAATMADEDDPSLARLRQRYAAGDLTDEQFERKLERLLETEPLEAAADRLQARE